MDTTIIREKLDLPLSWRRSPKLQRKKPPDRRLKLHGEARVSDDRDGEQKSVQDQQHDGYKAALARYGQGEGDFPFTVDNDISASDFGEDRPGWQELCELVATFGAVDVVITWAVNRLARNQTEGLHFMWLCWVNDVRIFVVKDYLEDIEEGGDGSRGEYNMRRDGDWEHVELAFKEAGKESRSKSRDIKRGKESRRRDGKLGGAVPGGWVRRYDPATGKPHHCEVVLEQAAVLVREVRELAAGTSPTTIARHLSRDGIAPFTPPRKPGRKNPNRFGTWSAPAVVATALNPAHIGKICARPLGENNTPRRRDLTSLAPAADYFPIVRGRRRRTASGRPRSARCSAGTAPRPSGSRCGRPPGTATWPAGAGYSTSARSGPAGPRTC